MDGYGEGGGKCEGRERKGDPVPDWESEKVATLAMCIDTLYRKYPVRYPVGDTYVFVVQLLAHLAEHILYNHSKAVSLCMCVCMLTFVA